MSVSPHSFTITHMDTNTAQAAIDRPGNVTTAQAHCVPPLALLRIRSAAIDRPGNVTTPDVLSGC